MFGRQEKEYTGLYLAHTTPPSSTEVRSEWIYTSFSPRSAFTTYAGATSFFCRLRLKCDGTRAEARFRLSAKRTSPFKSAGASVQSTIGSRGERISGNNAGYTMFRGSVKSTGYPFHSPVSSSLLLLCVTVRHHISTGLYRNHGTLRYVRYVGPCRRDVLVICWAWDDFASCGVSGNVEHTK